MAGRDQPPSVQDGPLGWEPGAVNNFERPGQNPNGILTQEAARKLGREVWDSSTNWLASGRRARWNDSLRAFQNLHSSGSKFLSGDYRYRSTMFRPKTRAMVRRDEAATAAAFFSNEDVVSITPEDDDDPQQLASAEILKALLQYRLTQTIPWFMTLVGARQDAEVMGICVGKVYWEYQERYLRTENRPRLGPDGMGMWDDDLGQEVMDEVEIFEKIKDQPAIDLLAPENFRFEPGCDWRDPVQSSPYLIEMQPVYIQEARERMAPQHGAPAQWLPVAESALRGASDLDDDVTRRTREAGRVPGKDHDAWKPKDFDICWTRINTMRWGGQDWWFRTLAGAGEMLEPPRPLRDVHLHGQRPYAVGCVVLETHKTYPSAKVELMAQLQRAANQDWNSRFDAVMLALQPRQFVRNGSADDINDLRTFAPGKVVQLNAAKDVPMNQIITWDRPPPVDAAAFQEQDRINLDWDDLSGGFANSSVQSSQLTQQSATGMHLMSGEASGISEYELRLFTESWVQKIIQLFVKLEQAYETDPTVLAIAGKKAGLFMKYGISTIDDNLLNQGLTTKVNVGIGATNPQMKLRNFATGADIIGKIFGPTAAMGSNFQEVTKEVFGLLGYKDGARFFQPGFDPRVAMLQQQLQKTQKGVHQQAPPDQTRVQSTQIQTQGRLQEQQLKNANDERLAGMDAAKDHAAEQAENWRALLQHQREMEQMRLEAVQFAHQASRPQPMQVSGASASELPHHAMSGLAEGHVTTFGNGQRWSLRGGKPRRMG
jgi:hypothetical protein